MDISAIAAVSIDMHLSQVQQAVDVSLLKNTMDSQESQAAALLDGMLPAPSAPPVFGDHFYQVV